MTFQIFRNPYGSRHSALCCISAHSSAGLVFINNGVETSAHLFDGNCWYRCLSLINFKRLVTRRYDL